MAQLKAIIFDVDGTIANTEETHRQAFNTAFIEFGLNYAWSEQEYIKLLSISGGKERIFAYLKKYNFTPNDGQDLREFSLQLHQRKSEIYREKLISGHISLRNGVARLIKETTEKNIRLAIATSTSSYNVETLLKNVLEQNEIDYFDTVVTSDIVTDKKPSPVVYQFALAELGLRPDVCIAIEDTHNGNQAALAAGLKTIITTHVFTRDDQFEGATLVLDQLGEPTDPFSVMAGDVYGSNYVDIELIEKMLEEGDIPSEIDHLEPQLAVAPLR